MGSLGKYLERRLIADRLTKLEEGGGTEVHCEAGRVCIVNEMQILVEQRMDARLTICSIDSIQ